MLKGESALCCDGETVLAWLSPLPVDKVSIFSGFHFHVQRGGDTASVLTHSLIGEKRRRLIERQKQGYKKERENMERT